MDHGNVTGDFNNYITPGIWYYDGNQHVANTPGDVAGNLEVIVTSACVIQRITVYDTIITRRKIGTTWTPWVQYAKSSDLNNKLSVNNMTAADALSYIGKNYDISVGGSIELTGVGQAGYGYFYNRSSIFYNLQHYYDHDANKMYERVITEQLTDSNWTVAISSENGNISKLYYASDDPSPYVNIYDSTGKAVAYIRIDGQY